MNITDTTALPSSPHRLRRPPRYRWVMTVVVAAVVFLIGSFLVALSSDRTSQAERDAAASQAVAAADPVRDLCAETTLVGAALRADPRNPCGLAARVLADPIPTVTPMAAPRDAPGITPEQIQAAVADELARNPPADGRTPSLAEVTAIVASLLADNPDQIAAQVALYFAENPVRDGRDAPEITPEQIREAVRAELAENPPERGADGGQGAQGVGVSDVRTELTAEGCVLIFTLTNPADGATTEQSVPVPDEFCTPSDPPVIEVG